MILEILPKITEKDIDKTGWLLYSINVAYGMQAVLAHPVECCLGREEASSSKICY